MKYIRFNIKIKWKRNLTTDKFSLISSLWNAFIETVKNDFVPSAYVTVNSYHAKPDANLPSFCSKIR